MSRRIIHTEKNDLIAAKVQVYRDSEWDEYVCRLFRFGVLYEPADSFHTDKKDALDTAKAMLSEEMVRQGVEVVSGICDGTY